MKLDLEKILITGAGGMLGSYIDFGVRLDHHSLDVGDLASVRAACAAHRPRVIFHLAAATDLVGCEKDQAQTYHTNAIGTYHMALAARDIGAKLVYVSTSAVFDGKKEAPYREDDMPNPQSVYGHSKYLGELAVRGILDDYMIARTCWIFGGGPEKDHKFVANIIRQAQNSKIEVIGGKRGSPTYGKDLVQELVHLAEEDARGTYHIGNAGAPTRVEIAREIVRAVGSRAEVVEADASVFEKKYPGAGARGNESIESEKITLRPWQEALREYVATEWHGKFPKE